MAVPAPSIRPTGIDGGTLHLRYVGTVGVSGESAVALNVDLTAMQEQLRKSEFFVDQLQIEFKALDAGITEVTPVILEASDFHGNPITYVTLLVLSDSDANQCLVTVTLPHSVVR